MSLAIDIVTTNINDWNSRTNYGFLNKTMIQQSSKLISLIESSAPSAVIVQDLLQERYASSALCSFGRWAVCSFWLNIVRWLLSCLDCNYESTINSKHGTDTGWNKLTKLQENGKTTYGTGGYVAPEVYA